MQTEEEWLRTAPDVIPGVTPLPPLRRGLVEWWQLWDDFVCLHPHPLQTNANLDMFSACADQLVRAGRACWETEWISKVVVKAMLGITAYDRPGSPYRLVDYVETHEQDALLTCMMYEEEAFDDNLGDPGRARQNAFKARLKANAVAGCPHSLSILLRYQHIPDHQKLQWFKRGWHQGDRHAMCWFADMYCDEWTGTEVAPRAVIDWGLQCIARGALLSDPTCLKTIVRTPYRPGWDKLSATLGLHAIGFQESPLLASFVGDFYTSGRRTAEKTRCRHIYMAGQYLANRVSCTYPTTRDQAENIKEYQTRWPCIVVGCGNVITISKDEEWAYNNIHMVFLHCNENARWAAISWAICARRMGFHKDMRRMICRLIWGTRVDWFDVATDEEAEKLAETGRGPFTLLQASAARYPHLF